MGIIDDLVNNVALPRMARARQVFPDDRIADVGAALRAQIRQPAIQALIRPGASIAVGVGSRGIAELPLLVSTTVDELKAAGAKPFVVPAMGSHGGASAEGQKKMLEQLGVTEATAGCPIRATMDVVEIGRLPNGLAVLMDAEAMQADGIVVINRVKPHTSFSGRIESGMIKMLSIGLGKQKGADSCHQRGFGELAQNIFDMGVMKIERTPVLFGVASVENSYDRICRIEAVPAPEIVERESGLLIEAKGRMPKILFNPLDVLVIERMGKEFSGTGMDPNITGRAGTTYLQTEQKVGKMVVLDLSDKTKGNATGLGLADICTKRLFGRIDYDAFYTNHITSTTLLGAKVPMMMNTDRQAVQCGVKTCNVADTAAIRMVRIPNTLHLGEIRISEGLMDEARANPQIEILSEPEPWAFDNEGRLAAS